MNVSRTFLQEKYQCKPRRDGYADIRYYVAPHLRALSSHEPAGACTLSICDQKLWSAWQCCAGDIIWVYHCGAPLHIHTCTPEGIYNEYLLAAPGTDDSMPCVIIPAYTRMRIRCLSEESDTFTCVSCCTVPAYDISFPAVVDTSPATQIDRQLLPSTRLTAEDIIATLALNSHPKEGGHFREIYRSAAVSENNEDTCATVIYYLLKADTYSEWHALSCDEIWLHIAGERLQQCCISPKGDVYYTMLSTEDELYAVLPPNTWQTTRLDAPYADAWSLVACITVPAFVYEKYTSGDQKEIEKRYGPLPNNRCTTGDTRH